MGGVPNSNTWQVFKWGYGPSLDGIFTQSNYGIVTKLGIWLMPQPPAYKPFCIRFPDETDIVDIVETIRPLRISMIIPNAIVIASTIWEAAVTVKRSSVYQGKGQIPDDVLKDVAKNNNLGAWNVYAALYGSPEQIEVNWQIIQHFFKKHPKARIVTEQEEGNNPVFQYRSDLMRGKPNLTEFGLYNWRGGGGSMWFAPVSQAMGSETLKQMEMAKRILAKHGLDYVAEFIVGWRDMHHIIDVLFDKSNPEEVKAANACFGELLDEFTKAGYGTYRTNTEFMDKVADTYGPVQRKVFQKLKRALDPNGILSPGKSGIRI
jgi:4-cresol dehydrogenase (hydroxylating) flavoprotein subunit